LPNGRLGRRPASCCPGRARLAPLPGAQRSRLAPVTQSRRRRSRPPPQYPPPPRGLLRRRTVGVDLSGRDVADRLSAPILGRRPRPARQPTTCPRRGHRHLGQRHVDQCCNPFTQGGHARASFNAHRRIKRGAGAPCCHGETKSAITNRGTRRKAWPATDDRSD